MMTKRELVEGVALIIWRLGSLSARTFPSPTIVLTYALPEARSNSKPRRAFRNPLVVALELAEEMKQEGLTQAGLARKHGISRARVNQWLALLRLPEGERKRVLAMGDYWDRRVITERMLRKALRIREEGPTSDVCGSALRSSGGSHPP